MIPGINPREMQKAMKRLGVSQDELDAVEVIIKLKDNKELVFKNPSVSKVNMMGQQSYQVVGECEEKVREVSISEEDVKTVMEQTDKTKEEVMQVLKKNKGDLAQTIMELKGE